MSNIHVAPGNLLVPGSPPRRLDPRERCLQRRAIPPPIVQFVRESVHGTAFAVEVAMHGQSLLFFPTLDSSRFPAEVGGDLLP